MDKIVEGKARIYSYKSEKISSEMPVFYNPVMTENRTISIIIARSFFSRPIRALFPLAASGVRPIRFILEGVDLKEVYINDLNPRAVGLIKKNIKLNKIDDSNITITREDARILMLKERNFDYVDIDPFGAPNPFIESALNAVKHKGLLAVTATDLSSLAGSYPSTCKWKYWAIPIRNHLKHEAGLRILIRKIQLIAAQHEKALIPILCYYSRHYYRCFFQVLKSKNKALRIINNHRYLKYNPDTSYELIDEQCGNTYGPLWAGLLGDRETLRRAVDLSGEYEDKNISRLLSLMLEDVSLGIPFFYDTSALLSAGVIEKQPRIDSVINMLRENKFLASRTIFSSTGFKTNARIRDIKRILSQLLV